MSETAPDGFEARAAFLLGLREQGVRDLAVLRALEAVPRAAFVADRHASLGYRNVALPTDCGQTVPEPLLVARLLAGSRLEPHMRVLLIGLGSGYTAAVLSHLVESVVALERFEALVDAAAERIAGLGRSNVDARWADGLAFASDQPFDRVIVSGLVDPFPSRFWSLVKDGAAVVHGRGAPPGPVAAHGQVLVRVERQGDGIGRQTILGPSRLPPLRPGLVAAT